MNEFKISVRYVKRKKKYDIVNNDWIALYLPHFVDFHREDPCSPQLPTLRSVSTPEEEKTRNLPTCFPTDCACRKTER